MGRISPNEGLHWEMGGTLSRKTSAKGGLSTEQAGTIGPKLGQLKVDQKGSRVGKVRRKEGAKKLQKLLTNDESRAITSGRLNKSFVKTLKVKNWHQAEKGGVRSGE